VAGDHPLWWTLRRPLRRLTYHAAHRMFTRAGAQLGANWTLLSRPGARCRCCHRSVSRAARRTRRAISRQRALHGVCHQAGFAGGHGSGILLPRLA